MNKNELIRQLASYFEGHEEFLAYAYTYMYECHPADAPDDIAPMDFLYEHLNCDAFYFDTNDKQYSRKEILRIFGNSFSQDTFNPNHIYVAFYSGKMQLVTTNNPMELINPEAFAKLIFSNRDALVLFLNEIVEEDDIVHDIFNCKKEDIING